jgi:phospholipid transport system substrate-binding protein
MRSTISSSPRTGKIAVLSLAFSFIVGIFVESAAALAVDPQTNVRGFYDTLLNTMKNGRALGQSGRYARLVPVVDRVFDLPSMTRLAIGSSWGTLPAAQQQQLTEAFRHYIAATYADRFDSYSGEQLQVTGEQPYNADIIVQTKIVKSNGETTTLNYLMRQNQGSWQISDVYLDGTISQLAVQRSEFNSILRREGIEGLVMALNRKVDLLGRGVASRPSGS